jgi:hypothetical protein
MGWKNELRITPNESDTTSNPESSKTVPTLYDSTPKVNSQLEYKKPKLHQKYSI